MKRKLRILLADDHKLVRQGFRLILLSQPDMDVVGETGNGREAVELATTLQPDVVLMDVTMPELNGIEATRRIREAVPRTRVLALSVHRDSVYVREIIRAGAEGYLLKESADTDFSLPSGPSGREELPQPRSLQRYPLRLPQAGHQPPRPPHFPRARGPPVDRRRQNQ